MIDDKIRGWIMATKLSKNQFSNIHYVYKHSTLINKHAWIIDFKIDSQYYFGFC